MGDPSPPFKISTSIIMWFYSINTSKVTNVKGMHLFKDNFPKVYCQNIGIRHCFLAWEGGGGGGGVSIRWFPPLFEKSCMKTCT